ncbi:MAG: InlB B-repeat-containing protein, partial [Eggerthellaceae bacterium]|nr:InlB B-repeat-containing protein [Eggerthellaceae bacterium]
GVWSFDGWETDDASVDADGKFTMPGKDVAFTGSWTFTADPYYKVTYALDTDSEAPATHSSLPTEKQYQVGSNVTVEGALTTTETTNAKGETGVWSFDGWETDDASVDADGKFTMPGKDVAFTGSWTFTADPYSVIYTIVNGTWADGSTDDITETGTYAQPLPNIPIGMKPNVGYDQGSGSWGVADITLETVKGEGLIYTYTYLENEAVIIKYVADIVGGLVDKASESVAPVTGNPQGSLAIPSPGYNFSQWRTSLTVDATNLTNAQVLPVQNGGLFQETTYTAYFAPKTDLEYTVHYYLVGTTTKLAEDKVATDQTMDTDVSESAIDIYGYTVDAASKILKLKATDNEITFYYTPNVYTVTFNIVNGTWADGTTEPITQAYTYGTDLDNIPTGMKGNSPEFDQNTGAWALIPLEGTIITGDLEFTYTYAPNIYTVTFIDRDGEILDAVQVAHGEDATPPNTPEHEGWIFVGWEGNYTNVTKDETVTASYIEPEEIEEFAKYTVTYYGDKALGTTPLAAEIVLDTKELSGIIGSSVTAAILDFTGYTHDAANPNNVLSGTIAEDDSLELKVFYTLNTYTVIFIDHDGEIIESVQVEHGSDATAPADPTREGWVFDGWSGKYTNITADTVVRATYVEVAVEPEPEAPAKEEPQAEPEKVPAKKVPDTGDTTKTFSLLAMALGTGSLLLMGLSLLQRRPKMATTTKGSHARK